MKRILIIEDDEAYQKMLYTVLTEAGFSVSATSDGEKGCSLFREESFDLVITDIFMPEKEGFETIMEIRELSADVKIIAISGGGQFDAMDMLPMSKELGADEVMEKPIAVKQLLQLIEQLFSD